MRLARPIGFSLSKPLLERLDAIARTEGVSRSSVARTFLVEGLADYEQKIGSSDLFATNAANLSRPWRPGPRREEDATSRGRRG